MKRSKGFTLVELLVVVGIIAMLVGILMPTLGRAREIAQVAMCAANLNAIGKGIQLHMTDTEQYPRLWNDATNAQLMAPFTTTSDVNDIAQLTNKNAMNNVWALIKDNTLQEEHFECPSDGDYKSRKDCESAGTAPLSYGWNAWENFSYGTHKPQPANDNTHMSPLSTKLAGSFPIFADKNYHQDYNSSVGKVAGKVWYDSTTRWRKPGNHPRDGFNWLTMGSSCKKMKYSEGTRKRFSACGINGDDIYLPADNNGTTGDVAVAATNPNRDTDAFILPWKVSTGGGGGGGGL
jgi:prepilin-type N-terminal cleavage/methylation domain-containing protein